MQRAKPPNRAAHSMNRNHAWERFGAIWAPGFPVFIYKDPLIAVFTAVCIDELLEGLVMGAIVVQLVHLGQPSLI
jgi:hypothetical protein